MVESDDMQGKLLDHNQIQKISTNSSKIADDYTGEEQQLLLADKKANRERAESIITDSGVLTVPREDPENKCRSKSRPSKLTCLSARVLLVHVLPPLLPVLLLSLLEGEGVRSSQT